ncbi:putative receptor-like serine/threonine-protein kinase ALE2-like [Capsicum annuum]|nr:putative receptor-like serine/threonine-protein kinase ALE2-like [Capsicum annuum]KAF3666390.1 putative receptor-like serine/threonine-protein kinase ALE2-like [Capsicum annuum]
MGNFWSKRQQNHHHHHHHPPPPPPPSSSIAPPFPTLAPPQPQPPHPTYSLPPPSQNPYPFRPPPPPPPHNYPPPSTSYYHFSFSHTRPVLYQNHYPPYYHPQTNNGWLGLRPPPPPPLPEVPYVDHQNAKKIQNDVNVHKDTIKVQVDELNKDSHLVSFTFDALVDGRTRGWKLCCLDSPKKDVVPVLDPPKML